MGTRISGSYGLKELPVRGGVWDAEEAASHAALLSVMANPERLRIVLAIDQSPLSTVTQLAEDVGLSRNRVSTLLAALRRHGYVRALKLGRHTNYQICDERIRMVLHALQGDS